MQPLHTLCRRIGNFVLLFGAMPDLHYINGPDTLPPPLTPQEEQQALCGLAAGEGAARDALITHNLRLVVYIAKKFESSTAGVEDMISIGTIGRESFSGVKSLTTFCNIMLKTIVIFIIALLGFGMIRLPLQNRILEQEKAAGLLDDPVELSSSDYLEQ